MVCLVMISNNYCNYKGSLSTTRLSTENKVSKFILETSHSFFILLRFSFILVFNKEILETTFGLYQHIQTLCGKDI